MNVSYKDSESAPATSETALRQSIEAKDAMITRLQTQLEGFRKRVNRFIGNVESVQFSVDEAQADPWMSQWGAYLLSGKEPRRVEPEPQPEAEDDFDTQSE